MNKIKIMQLTCLRCFHKWIPRKADVTVCPKCKSPYWNRRKDQPAAEEKNK